MYRVTEEFLWKKLVSKEDHPGGCWLWKGYVDRKGYGVLWKQMAHRAIYILLRGQIPSDCDVHHTCRNKWCVNPDHMEIVSRSKHSTDHARRYGKNRVPSDRL